MREKHGINTPSIAQGFKLKICRGHCCIGGAKVQVTGHCFTNTESILNIHNCLIRPKQKFFRPKVSFFLMFRILSVLVKQCPMTCDL